MNNNKNYEIKFTPGLPLEKSPYPGLNVSTYTLKKNSIQKEGAMPLLSDVLVEQDTPVQLRDGTTIRVDIYRPIDHTNCPALLWYAPYGKRGSVLNLDMFQHPTRMDVPTNWEDGLNSFESPNPSYWVSHGYAVVSPDPRGVGSSEGNIYCWGPQSTEGEYDLIEWIAAQKWSNGKIGLTGTSYLSMTQYAVAASQPPHLTAIAPFEGAFSPYKETMARGGILDMSFSGGLLNLFYTKNKVEDLNVMMQEHPFFDEYWADKDPNVSLVNIPVYFVASWTNVLHSYGTLKAYREIGSKEKWLRIHNTHEWNDYYNPQNVENLRKFFDYYLKGLKNNWTDTPKVQMTVLNPGHKDIVCRAETAYPLERQRQQTLYLVNNSSKLELSKIPQVIESNICYDSSCTDGVNFTIKMPEATEYIGDFSLKLWVEAEGNDDMDIYAYIRKRDVHGNIVEPTVVTDRYYPGPNGQLRVSCRALDEKLSSTLSPVLKLTSSEKLHKHEIVAVDIPFWPFGMKWEAGETLELQICPTCKIVRPEFPDMMQNPTINKGTHVIHIGGQYKSALYLPIIEND